MPTDTEKYPLITKDPSVFFTFVNEWASIDFENITIDELAQGKLLGNQVDTSKDFDIDIQRLDESLYIQLQKFSKFELVKKKDEIIQSLKVIHKKYYAEYSKYNDDVFVIPFCGTKALTGYTQNPLLKCRQSLSESQYDFDNLILNYDVLQDGDGWYGKYLGRRHAPSHPGYAIKHVDEAILLRWTKAPMPLDVAETLFSGDQEPEVLFRFVVQPRSGWLFDNQAWAESGYMISNFDILQIKGTFYKGEKEVYEYQISDVQ